MTSFFWTKLPFLRRWTRDRLTAKNTNGSIDVSSFYFLKSKKRSQSLVRDLKVDNEVGYEGSWMEKSQKKTGFWGDKELTRDTENKQIQTIISEGNFSETVGGGLPPLRKNHTVVFDSSVKIHTISSCHFLTVPLWPLFQVGEGFFGVVADQNLEPLWQGLP